MRASALSQPSPIPVTQVLAEFAAMLLVIAAGVYLTCIPAIVVHTGMMHFAPMTWHQPIGAHPVVWTVGTVAYVAWAGLCVEGVMEVFRTINPDAARGWKPWEAGITSFFSVMGALIFLIAAWPILHHLAT